MTFVPTVTTTAATAAAAHQEALRREEEAMTPYSTDESEGWEFKIVRSASAKFKHPDVVRRLREEEAVAGWELLEKFDDNRIRFKRRVEHRAEDANRGGDPYRTHYGMSPTRMGLIAAGCVLALGLAAALLVFYLNAS